MKRNDWVHTGRVVLLMVGLASGAAAQTALNYNESSYPGGDFPGSGFPNIGTLGIGVNTITGSVRGSFDGGGDFLDTFSVTLPAGLVITAGQFVVTNFTYCTTSCTGGITFNQEGSLAEPLNGFTGITGSGVYGLTANVPYSSPGSLNVAVQSSWLAYSGQTSRSGEFTYTLQYTVAQAPTAVSDAAFQVRYAANLQFGESYVNISNDGANGAPLAGPGIGGASANICVNVYAFDPNEEMISCCSCLLTPDQTRNLGVNRDILSNTATGVVPTSVTIKLLATLAGSGGSGTSCTTSAAGVATATVVNGLVAFGTTLHATPAAGTYDTTETPFIPATLSAEEQAALANRCTNIVGNLSGFGICASCRAGALGAGKM